MSVFGYVERALREYEVTRNDDRKLCLAVWYYQNPNYHENFKNFFLTKAIMPESITRARRKFQEQGKYLASNKVQEERYRKFKNMRGGDFSEL